MANVYLLTGMPGAGKTTIIRETISRSKVKAGGFYTQEIRAGAVRKGFKITTLDGQEAILSHVEFSSPYHVSKYGVDIDSLDNTGVTALYQAINQSDLIVIDEIGKMELLSPRFREAVLQTIASDKKVLGTIMLNHHPFADRIKNDPRVKTITVNRANHDQVLSEVLKWLAPTNYENNS